MNWDILENINKRILLIVAHPDDETIFCGGTMLLYPNYKWTVISVTDCQRSSEFNDAMEFFKKLGVNIVSYKTLGQKDIKQEAELSGLVQEKDMWEVAIKKESFSADLILTHNEVGEYGHGAHKLLNAVVTSLFSDNIWKFIYPKEKQPHGNKIEKVDLSKEILEKKTEIFKKAYKSQEYLWKEFVNLMPYEFQNGPEIFTSD